MALTFNDILLQNNNYQLLLLQAKCDECAIKSYPYSYYLLIYFLIVFQNCSLYNFDGKTKIINVNIGGTDEIKYAIRYNHGLRFDCIQPTTNEMIKRGNDNMIRTNGAINKC